MELLGGVEERIVRGTVREEEGESEEDEGEELGRQEVIEAIAKIKDGKAPGADEIPGEAWKYEGGGIERLGMERM